MNVENPGVRRADFFQYAQQSFCGYPCAVRVLKKIDFLHADATSPTR